MLFKTTLAAVALVLTTGMASAVTISPIAADCGTGLLADLGTVTAGSCGGGVRNNTGNVNSGAGDGLFYSLGLKGSALFGITPNFTGPGSVVEVTWGGTPNLNGVTHTESADIFGRLLDGTFALIGQVNNVGSTGTQSNTSIFTFVGQFNAIRFVDTSPSGGGSADGFDIDAFSVTPVPLPAGFALLLTGLAGLVVAGRRRRNAAA